VSLPSGDVIDVEPLLAVADAPSPAAVAAAPSGPPATTPPQGSPAPQAAGSAVPTRAPLQQLSDDQARLRALLGQLEAAEGDDTAARQALLTEVLSGAAFQQPPTLWERFLRWLAAHLPEPSENPQVARQLEASGWLVVGLGLAGGLWLARRWLRRLLLELVADADLGSAGALSDLPPSSAAARDQAAALAQIGNYREGIRRLYLAALLQLEERGLLRYDRSLTNREYLGQLRQRPALQARLAPIVGTFDDVWYGVHEPDAAAFADYAAAVADLEAAARQPEARA
jgi:hypothetical protein